MRVVMLVVSLLLALTATASAQCAGSCVYQSNGTTLAATICCMTASYGTASPDDTTLAMWAAKKAVALQLNWFDEKEVAKLDRDGIDALQTRVDNICKWAKTLSNHILAAAYAEWGSDAKTRIDQRRRSLDQIDVAKSLVVGLPTPPDK